MGNIFPVMKNDSSPLLTSNIEVADYEVFAGRLASLLNSESAHCVSYYCVRMDETYRFFCAVAEDSSGTISLLSHELKDINTTLRSLTPEFPQLHIFEREIHENYGIRFSGHPWLKPVRYFHDRADRGKVMDNYPFYSIGSEELHEVGVGPVHAGVIEPGHFRFICNGEKVLHLEIQLGYQHRGVERLFVEKENPLQRSLLSENIAGDTAVGHSLAHTQLIESLAGISSGERIRIERCIALEMERMAVHIGDTAALCGDVAYQLGQAACEALRTVVINLTQQWCGNRFGKGLVRPGGTNYPLTPLVAEDILCGVNAVRRKYDDIAGLIFSLPSVLGRFDGIGQVSVRQGLDTGAVGMAARSCGIPRDIRNSHPFQYYKKLRTGSRITETGDVLARARLRHLEIQDSVTAISDLVERWKSVREDFSKPRYNYTLMPSSFGLSLVEGWRGEICHTALTDRSGNIIHYKVKDPSFHNWMVLALSVRNQEISDFPVCNKSFNLSYCGNDL